MKYVVPLFHASSGRVGVGPQNWTVFQYGFGFVLQGNRLAQIAWDPWWKPSTGGERRKADRRRNFVRLADFVQKIRENGPLAQGDLRLLVDFFRGLCKGQGYAQWRKDLAVSTIFVEPGWSEQEHRKKFAEYAVASCLDTLSPGTVWWRPPHVPHMELVSKFVHLFPNAPPGPQRKAIRDFCEGGATLRQVTENLKPPKVRHSLNALRLVWRNRGLEPKPFYEKLQNPLKRYGVSLSAKPHSYRKQIQRLKQATMKHERLIKEIERDVT